VCLCAYNLVEVAWANLVVEGIISVIVVRQFGKIDKILKLTDKILHLTIQKLEVNTHFGGLDNEHAGGHVLHALRRGQHASAYLMQTQAYVSVDWHGMRK
jgi:hypothetical protein